VKEIWLITIQSSILKNIVKIRVRLEPLKKDRLNLAGRDPSIALTKKAYSYLKYLYKVVEIETPGLTAPCLTPVLGNTTQADSLNSNV
jgi:hypothetical protein